MKLVKVAVAACNGFWAPTASPASADGAMVTVFENTGVQSPAAGTPAVVAKYASNLLPLRTSFSQNGALTPTSASIAVLAPALARDKNRTPVPCENTPAAKGELVAVDSRNISPVLAPLVKVPSRFVAVAVTRVIAVWSPAAGFETK